MIEQLKADLDAALAREAEHANTAQRLRTRLEVLARVVIPQARARGDAAAVAAALAEQRAGNDFLATAERTGDYLHEATVAAWRPYADALLPGLAAAMRARVASVRTAAAQLARDAAAMEQEYPELWRTIQRSSWRQGRSADVDNPEIPPERMPVFLESYEVVDLIQAARLLGQVGVNTRRLVERPRQPAAPQPAAEVAEA